MPAEAEWMSSTEATPLERSESSALDMGGNLLQISLKFLLLTN